MNWCMRACSPYGGMARETLLEGALHEVSAGFAPGFFDAGYQGSLASARQPFAMIRKAVGLRDKGVVSSLREAQREIQKPV